MAAHVYLANRSMKRRAFVNADGEMLLVPQQGRLRVTTELGVLERGPGEIALLPRGAGLQGRVARRALARLRRARTTAPSFRLPELGPIGSNGLANARDFLAPVAAFEADAGRVRAGQEVRRPLVARAQPRTPFNVVAWHGNLAPCKYDTAHFMTIGSISFDHPDPSIFTVLTSPSRHAGHRQLRLRDLPAALAGGGRHLPPALVPPQPDERVHGPGARPVRRQARGLQARRREPAQLHGAARARRRSLRARRATTPLAPHKLDNTLAFMFESRYRFVPTEFAMNGGALDPDYIKCWEALEDRFRPG